MRRRVKNRNHPLPDRKYQSVKVSKFINHLMMEGKKSVAEKIVYGSFDIIEEKEKTSPIEVFEAALKNAGPTMEVRSRRVVGANYQVPRETRPERRNYLAVRWILDAARAKKGKPMHQKLAEELIAASKNEGEAIKKRENTHKMAEANRAFAHFAW